MEAIVTYDNLGNLWCAYLDLEEKVIRYFTNTYSDVRPYPIQEWLLRFKDRRLIINDDLFHKFK